MDKNEKIIIVIIIVAVIMMNVMRRRKGENKKTDESKKPYQGPKAKIPQMPRLKLPGMRRGLSIPPSVISGIGGGASEEQPKENQPRDGDVDENTDIIGMTNDEKIITLVQLTYKSLEDYSQYAREKGWRNDWEHDEDWTARAAVNIVSHAYVETGGFTDNYVAKASNNIFNITGVVTYKSSPYIADIYGHDYVSSLKRPDNYYDENGNKVYQTQTFRGYQYVIDSILDYLDLLNRAVRYRGTIEYYGKPSAEFIRKIGYAGYYQAKTEQMYEAVLKARDIIIDIVAIDDSSKLFLKGE